MCIRDRFEGERNGRYFTDFTEGMFEEFVRKISGLQIENMWITGDVREGRGDAVSYTHLMK